MRRWGTSSFELSFPEFLDVKPLVESIIHPVAVTHPGDCRHFAQGHPNLRAGREWMRCSNSHAVLGNVQNTAKHSLGVAGTNRIDCSQALRWETRLDPPLGSADIV